LTKKKLSLRSIGRELRSAIEASQDKKASDLVVLDLRGLASFTDFFLLATGSSHRQLKAIADAIEEELAGMRVKPNHVEGYPHGDWILMDYVDFVIHIFTPRSRTYYDLERLWGDAERLGIAS
jgi:ribosome-associated protein